MGTGQYRRSRTHKGIKDLYKKFRVRRRTKDLDQIHEDLLKQKKILEVPTTSLSTANPLEEELQDLPGSGQFLCIECSRYFIDQISLSEHTKSKVHKRRLKLLKEVPYTIEEAERAAGMTK